MSLLAELDAFYTEHRRCGELEAGVDGPVVWIDCECGGQDRAAGRRGALVPDEHEMPAESYSMRGRRALS